MPINRRVMLSAAIATGLAAPFAGLSASPATAARMAKRPAPTPPGRTWVDPFAAAAPTASGRIIRALSGHGGLLYPGYGDWNANIGPLSLHTLNPATGTFSGEIMSFPGESMERHRVLNGSLYLTNIDPTTYWEGGQPFATNRTGSWQMSGWTNSVHVFDITTLPDGTIIVCGSYLDALQAANGRAVHFSYDGGQTWKAVCHFQTTINQMRAYSILNTAGGILVTVEDGSMWKWSGQKPTADSNEWAQFFTKMPAAPANPWSVATCSNGVVGVYGSLFAHTGTSTLPTPPGITALYSSDAWIYAATPTQLWRTQDARTWYYNATPLPETSTALAILGGSAYLGTRDSRIIEVPLDTSAWRSKRI